MPDNLPKSLIGRVGFGALLLALVLAPVIGGFPAGPVYNGDITLAALRCLVLVAALCLFGDREPAQAEDSGGNRWTLAVVWGTVGLVILSFLVQSRFFTSPVLLFASLPGTLDWLCYGLLFTLAVRFGRGRTALFLIGAMILAAGIAAVASVQEYGQFVQEGSPQQRAQGFFFSPNFAGGLMALLLPVAAAACIAVRQRLMPLVLGAIVAMMAGALFASGSRAGVAFSGVGLLIALGFSLPKLKDLPGALPRIGLLVLALLVLGFAFRGPLMQRVESAGQEQSGEFRSYTWKGTIAMTKAHPILGTGPGTFPYLYPKYAVVARTDLAHSSYLQMMAEEGIPAFVGAVAVLIMVLVSGGMRLIRAVRDRNANTVFYLLTAGLLGGLLTSLARSVFDSEWSILGNGFAFWTVAGLLQGGGFVPASSSVPRKRTGMAPTMIPVLVGLVAGLVLSLLCLNTARERVVLAGQIGQSDHLTAEGAGWPPDAQILYLLGRTAEDSGQLDDAIKNLTEAARIEPTGKRFYQLASAEIAQQDLSGAVAALKESVALEPTALQSWRRLAETQEKAGDTNGALESWKKLTDYYEGPVGNIRAIPEMTETYPAFAYVALGRDAARRGNISEAATLYEKAATIVERYAKTPALYQQVELTVSRANGTNVQARREEIKSLYQQIMTEWSGLQKERAGELISRRDETIGQLDKMMTPNTTTP
jgi:O-antigen ligase